jgi:hypothetical protein
VVPFQASSGLRRQPLVARQQSQVGRIANRSQLAERLNQWLPQSFTSGSTPLAPVPGGLSAVAAPQHDRALQAVALAAGE